MNSPLGRCAERWTECSCRGPTASQAQSLVEWAGSGASLAQHSRRRSTSASPWCLRWSSPSTPSATGSAASSATAGAWSARAYAGALGLLGLVGPYMRVSPYCTRLPRACAVGSEPWISGPLWQVDLFVVLVSFVSLSESFFNVNLVSRTCREALRGRRTQPHAGPVANTATERLLEDCGDSRRRARARAHACPQVRMLRAVRVIRLFGKIESLKKASPSCTLLSSTRCTPSQLLLTLIHSLPPYPASASH